MNREAPAIRVAGLEKSFGERPALRGVDLEVARGECLVVFGPNGAGKTTLLKVLATLLKPSAGSVLIGGRDIRKNSAEIRRVISLVSHQTFLYDDLTVLENLKFYGHMYAVPDLDERIGEVLAWAQLEPRRHDRVGTLSRGLQQRASLARAVLHNPAFLFLDEPEVGLDVQTTTMLEDILGNNSGRRTVVMTTHNPERGLALADSIAVIHRGRIVHRASGGISRAAFQDIYDGCIGASG